MKSQYTKLNDVEMDIVAEKPRLIFLTGKTCSGKTFLSNNVASVGYNIVKLDEVIYKEVMTKCSVSDPVVGFATYRGNASQEWIDYFVKKARVMILEQLKQGNVIVEGALAHNKMIEAVFADELKDFLFIFLQPNNVNTYASHIIKRFKYEMETGKTGLPKEFFQIVDAEKI